MGAAVAETEAGYGLACAHRWPTLDVAPDASAGADQLSTTPLAGCDRQIGNGDLGSAADRRRSRFRFADEWCAAPSRGSLLCEAATAGDVAAAPPASSKAPAVAGDSPARGALIEATGLGSAKPKRVHFQ